MKILFVVPKLPTDPQDDNHFRVEHHHAEGLTYSTCLINGVERFVRATSSPSQKRKEGSTILVHCNPLKRYETPRLRCANIPTVEVLRYVDKNDSWPTSTLYLALFNRQSIFQWGRLVTRKEDTLIHKGYVTQYDAEGIFCAGKAFLTEKGKQRLQQLEAQ